MSDTWIIVLMAVVTYVPRLVGFTLPAGSVRGFWLRFLRFVPVAVFAALIVPALPGSEGELAVRVAALSGAGLVLWRVRSLALGIVVGMALFWILRTLF